MHLTEQDGSRKDGDRQAGADETEITEEMISVAAEVLWKSPLIEISEGLALVLAEKMIRGALSGARKIR
jgi:hypothetical protein